jgi:hypothetical protein
MCRIVAVATCFRNGLFDFGLLTLTLNFIFTQRIAVCQKKKIRRGSEETLKGEKNIEGAQELVLLNTDHRTCQFT